VTTIFLRAVLLYILMVFAIRLMGKRQLGQFEPYELAMALLLADILATPMSDVSTPLLHGILPVAAMIGVHALITIISIKSDKARAVISGKPSLIISDGKIDYDELKRLSLSVADLLEGIRLFGIQNPWDVQYAIMEANGTITAFEKSKKRPPTIEELKMDFSDQRFPLALIMDGKIQMWNLKRANITSKELDRTLSAFSLSPSLILLATADDENMISLETKNGEFKKIEVIREERK